jgi:hypothetical protein
LKGCFKKIEAGSDIKEERGKKKEKKIIDAKSFVHLTHTLHRNGGATKTIRTSPWKPPFEN